MFSDLIIFNLISVVLVILYIIDNTIYACAYGLHKKERVISLVLETILELGIIAINVIEIVDQNRRFSQFYMRMIDILLIARKLQVTHMLLKQNKVRTEFQELNTE